nr:MAG TPA: hypothetical protein [Caudoviricetes sp.]
MSQLCHAWMNQKEIRQHVMTRNDTNALRARKNQ